MVNLVDSFPWVDDPRKACKILWDTFQCLLCPQLESLLVTIFLPFSRLWPTFIYPDENFAAILDSILLQFHVSPTQLAAFISWSQIGRTKTTTWLSAGLWDWKHQTGHFWGVCLLHSVWLLELKMTSQIPCAQEYRMAILHRKGTSEFFAGNLIACQAHIGCH